MKARRDAAIAVTPRSPALQSFNGADCEISAGAPIMSVEARHARRGDKIRVDAAHRRTPRCRGAALWQRVVAAIDPFAAKGSAVDRHAYWIARIVSLRLGGA